MPNNKLDKAKLFILFQPMWRENPLRPPFINTIGHLSQLHVRLGIVLGTLSCLFIAGLLLSPLQRPFCVVGRLGRGKNESAQGTMRSGKRGNEAFSLYPSSTARFSIFLIIAIFIGIPSGSLCGRAWERLSRIHQNFPGAIRPCSNPVSRETLK